MRFLIVDDDDVCRELLDDILQPYGERDFATNGDDAIDLFRAAVDSGRSYDAILLDIMMPGLDGQQTLKALRSIEQKQGTKSRDRVVVIMVSALADLEQIMTSVEKGCHSYVTKPIDEEQLLQELSDTLGSKFQAGREREFDSVTSTEDHTIRYLVVDDDEVCRELIIDILAPHGSCDFAKDGKEAVSMVEAALEQGRSYDAILLDIMMPEMDGHQTLKQIRSLESARGIHCLAGTKVIMTTAMHESSHILSAFRNGCEAYVTKPVFEQKLMEKLNEFGVLPEGVETNSRS